MRKSFKLLLVLLTLSVIQACSSGKVVKSYEGDQLTNDQIGLLVASENISVISINGKDVPRYMLNNAETTYGLKPGTNKVVFIYESIWAKAGKSNGKSKTDKVVSKELVVDVVTKAGESYHFSFLKPTNVREAKAAVKDMKVTVYDSANIVAALSRVYDPKSEVKELISDSTEKNKLQSSKSELLEDKSIKGSPASEVDNFNKYKVSNTEALKSIWAQMSAKEKKEFLVWAFQE